jgi:hypothetical protein
MSLFGKLLRMRRLVIGSLAVFLATGVGLALAQTSAKKAAPAPVTAKTMTPAPVKMPPLPNPGYPPPRPVDHTRAVYEFAAQHPEVLKYVPCYCGCEADGHPHNESCFVKSRDSQGNVTAWDILGYG